MTEQNLKEFKDTLSRHHAELLKLAEAKSAGQSIQLHDTTVKDILKTVSQFKDALERIEKGNFGACSVCGGEIELERMCRDFSTTVCLDHYSDEQIRDLERDLELTARMQRQLMPCCAPLIKDLQFAHISRPLGIVGGDYHDFFALGENLQGIIIADVMGKGLPASLVMANLQAALKILGPQMDSLDELAGRLNKFFRYNIKLMGFISLCLITLDVNQGFLEYCNAGHHPPLFRDNSHNKMHWLNPTGPAIGIITEGKYEIRRLDIAANDLLLLYTDGLVEARNAQGEEFGEERLYRFIENNYHKPVQELLDDLQKNVESFSEKLSDDLTLLAVKM